MKLPLSWIYEFIPHHPSINEVANALTSLGIEVDKVESPDILHLSFTPNLGHCLSVQGVARELAAYFNTKCILPPSSLKEGRTPASFEIYNHEPQLAPFFSARLIKNVKVAPSPLWLQKKLQAAGVKSINNIVDSTNYVLLEIGHPLHAFDLNKLEGALHIRKAHSKEQMVTLDGIKRELDGEMLVVADTEQAHAIAGVMGGLTSSITDQTTDILLEAALFHPSSIRRTSKKLQLSTDASKHFERGVDPQNISLALDRAASLIHALAGGEVLQGIVATNQTITEKRTLTLRPSKVNQLLGVQLGFQEMIQLLERLEFTLSYESEEILHIQVPTYRLDIKEEIDLIEEIARLYGYVHIKSKELRFSGTTIPHTPLFLFEQEVRQGLHALGLQEFLTCNLISDPLYAIVESDVPKNSKITTLHPASIEQSILRPSLLPGLLQVAKHNQDHGLDQIYGFEVGRIHFKNENAFEERLHAALLLSGREEPPFWKENKEELSFYTLKGIVEQLLEELSFSSITFEPSHLSFLHPYRQAAIKKENTLIGYLGEVHPHVLRTQSCKAAALFAELNLSELQSLPRKIKKMEPLPLFPAITRDANFSIPKNNCIQSLFDFIETLASPLLKECHLKTLFFKEGSDHPLANLHFVYRDNERTLFQEEAEKEHERLTAAINDFLTSTRLFTIE